MLFPTYAVIPAEDICSLSAFRYFTNIHITFRYFTCDDMIVRSLLSLLLP